MPALGRGAALWLREQLGQALLGAGSPSLHIEMNHHAHHQQRQKRQQRKYIEQLDVQQHRVAHTGGGGHVDNHVLHRRRDAEQAGQRKHGDQREAAGQRRELLAVVAGHVRHVLVGLSGPGSGELGDDLRLPELRMLGRHASRHEQISRGVEYLRLLRLSSLVVFTRGLLLLGHALMEGLDAVHQPLLDLGDVFHRQQRHQDVREHHHGRADEQNLHHQPQNERPKPRALPLFTLVHSKQQDIEQHAGIQQTHEHPPANLGSQ